MPIVIDSALPAYKILGGEKIFVMDKTRAVSQDIRPIEIAILNLMPTKEETETQFMRLLSNSPLQVNVTLLSTESYHGRHTAEGYLGKFYQSFRDVENKHFDGMIVTAHPSSKWIFPPSPIGTSLNAFSPIPKRTSPPPFSSAGEPWPRCIIFTV